MRGRGLALELVGRGLLVLDVGVSELGVDVDELRVGFVCGQQLLSHQSEFVLGVFELQYEPWCILC
jgi:hypothetical protein